MTWEDSWKRNLIAQVHEVPDPALRGEYTFYRTVLLQALEDYVDLREVDLSHFPKTARSGRSLYEKAKLFQDAEQWIFGKVAAATLEEKVMSFPNVCLTLGVTPREVRDFARRVTVQEMDRIKHSRSSSMQSETREP